MYCAGVLTFDGGFMGRGLPERSVSGSRAPGTPRHKIRIPPAAGKPENRRCGTRPTLLHVVNSLLEVAPSLGEWHPLLREPEAQRRLGI
jgi:hypothetical protein